MDAIPFVLCVWAANVLTFVSVIIGIAVYEEAASWFDWKRQTRGGQHVEPPPGIVKPAPPPPPPPKQ